MIIRSREPVAPPQEPVSFAICTCTLDHSAKNRTSLKIEILVDLEPFMEELNKAKGSKEIYEILYSKIKVTK